MNSNENYIDNSRRQYELFGNSIQTSPKELPQCEKTLLKHLICEMSKNGRYEEAFEMLCTTIDELQKRINDLEAK
jgi:hypothetical protein